MTMQSEAKPSLSDPVFDQDQRHFALSNHSFDWSDGYGCRLAAKTLSTTGPGP
jgi:hypothetical protein